MRKTVKERKKKHKVIKNKIIKQKKNWKKTKQRKILK